MLVLDDKDNVRAIQKDGVYLSGVHRSGVYRSVWYMLSSDPFSRREIVERQRADFDDVAWCMPWMHTNLPYTKPRASTYQSETDAHSHERPPPLLLKL